MPWVNFADYLHFRDDKLNKVPVFESPRMLLDVYCVGPGQSQKIHAHDNLDKVYLVLSGQVTVILDKEECPLTSGQAAVAPSTVPHGLRNDTDLQATVLVFQAKA